MALHSKALLAIARRSVRTTTGVPFGRQMMASSVPAFESCSRNIRFRVIVNTGHVAALRARAMKKGWGEPEWLFPLKTNTHLDRNHVAKRFKRALKDAKLPGFRVYDTRHT